MNERGGGGEGRDTGGERGGFVLFFCLLCFVYRGGSIVWVGIGMMQNLLYLPNENSLPLFLHCHCGTAITGKAPQRERERECVRKRKREKGSIKSRRKRRSVV